MNLINRNGKAAAFYGDGDTYCLGNITGNRYVFFHDNVDISITSKENLNTSSYVQYSMVYKTVLYDKANVNRRKKFQTVEIEVFRMW